MQMVFVIFVIASSVLVVIQAQSPWGNCKTPRQEDGLCVPIKTCHFIVRVLERYHLRPPPRITALLQTYKCGEFDGSPHVCCHPNHLTSKNHPSFERSSVEVQTGNDILNSTDCGSSDYAKVAGGQDVYIGEFPWMALLLYSTNERCGGSLITDQYVLTAAHCIRNKELLAVRLGEHDIRTAIDCVGTRRRKCLPPVQEIDVEEAIYHKDYRFEKKSHDIGLIRLATKARITDNIQPICLPITEFSATFELDRLYIAGWGFTDKGDANVLQKATVPAKPIQVCKRIYALFEVTDNQICAGGDNNVDVCGGDSGGPIFWPARYKDGVQFVQYGIASHGGGQCGTLFPGVYAKTYAYLSWIAGNIRL